MRARPRGPHSRHAPGFRQTPYRNAPGGTDGYSSTLMVAGGIDSRKTVAGLLKHLGYNKTLEVGGPGAGRARLRESGKSDLWGCCTFFHHFRHGFRACRKAEPGTGLTPVAFGEGYQDETGGSARTSREGWRTLYTPCRGGRGRNAGFRVFQPAVTGPRPDCAPCPACFRMG